MRRVFFFLVILWGLSSAASERDCTPVDLTKKVGAPRNQGDTSWCYAHVAADLISAQVGFRVSAFDLAIQYILARNSDMDSVQDPQLAKFLQDPVRRDYLTKSRLSDVSGFEFLKILTKEGITKIGGEEDTAIGLSNLKGLCLQERLPENEILKGSLESIEYLQSQWQIILESGRPIRRLTSSKEQQDVSRLANEMSWGMTEVIRDWVDQKCGRRLHFKTPLIPRVLIVADDAESLEKDYRSGKLDRQKTHRKLWSRVDNVLSQGEIVGVGYSANDIMVNEDGSAYADHASVISRRRFHNGRCEYFLRNTWADDCSFYLPNVSPQCVPSHGGVWLTDDELPSLYSVTDFGPSR